MTILRSSNPRAAAILVGSIVGILLSIAIQFAMPLAGFFLSPFRRSVGVTIPPNYIFLTNNPIAALLAYLAIPVPGGIAIGLRERENLLADGLISGLVSGAINLTITVLEIIQGSTIALSTNSSASIGLGPEMQFFLSLIILLTLLWGFISATSAIVTTWLFERDPTRIPTIKTYSPIET